MKYLLDTNILTALEKAPLGAVYHRILKVGIDNVVTSIIVAGEAHFGSIKSRSPKLKSNVEDILAMLDVLPLEPPVHEYYGRIRAELERKGTPIGGNDLWIAAHALALNLTLVTDNVGEFERVERLRVENWLR